MIEVSSHLKANGEDSSASSCLWYAWVFSFLLSWEQTQKDMSALLNEGDVWNWPVEPSRASQIARVRLVHGGESIFDKLKELHVRAEVVRQVAYLYIENHMQDLVRLPGARLIHARMQGDTTQGFAVGAPGSTFRCMGGTSPSTCMDDR